MVEPGQPVPKGGGVYRVGKPYQVAGRTYTPEENGRYRAEGLASWYGDDFHGRLTANGEVYDMEAISAAHPTLPMPSYVRVTNLSTHKSLIVRVNDRGPYQGNREIDLSERAADLLGFRHHGTAKVRVEYVGPAPLEGTDDRQLMATLRQGQPAPAPVMVAGNRFLPNFNRPPLPRRRCRRSGPTISARAIVSRRPRAYPQRATPACWRAKRSRAIRSGPRVADVSPDTETPRHLAAKLRAAEARGQPATEVTSNGRAPAQWAPPAAGGFAGHRLCADPPRRRASRSRPGAASTKPPIRFVFAACRATARQTACGIALFWAFDRPHGLGKFLARSIHLARAAEPPGYDQPCQD